MEKNESDKSKDTDLIFFIKVAKEALKPLIKYPLSTNDIYDHVNQKNFKIPTEEFNRLMNSLVDKGFIESRTQDEISYFGFPDEKNKKSFELDYFPKCNETKLPLDERDGLGHAVKQYFDYIKGERRLDEVKQKPERPGTKPEKPGKPIF
ncbi:hypothetical protein SU86_007330 [Candidatus Nitrosotenuis cloacae]|uniref:Uncharacterized protein n=2 Tax=Candidatus Nitrosotenuis cloacae TaxID=1603555 RepID=A0A3G1B252_9ARCH|nr:hypothetical protein SU86_007330 [Candidatus Nitrosotenuis cloacae]